MKNKIWLSVLVALFAVGIGLPLLFVNTNSVANAKLTNNSSIATKYIANNHSDYAQQTGNQITFSQQGTETGATWLQINIPDGLSNVKIKRIIKTTINYKVSCLSKDDINESISDAEITYTFYQDGTYVVLFEVSGTKYYASCDFEHEFDLSKILTIQNGKFYQNTTKTNNIIVKNGEGALAIQSNNDANSPYTISFAAETEFASNITQDFFVKVNDNTIFTTKLQIFAQLPEIVFVADAQNQIDLLQAFDSEYGQNLSTDTKYFDKDVEPQLDLSILSDNGKTQFNNYFELKTVGQTDTYLKSTYNGTASIVFKSDTGIDEQIEFNTQKYNINTAAPTEYLNLHIGDENSEIYPNWVNNVYTVASAIYPKAINEELYNVSTYINGALNNSVAQDQQNSVTIIGKIKSRDSVAFVYTINVVRYDAGGTNFRLINQQIDGSLKIKKPNATINVPVDLIIINLFSNDIDTAPTYLYKAFLLGNEEEKDFTITTPGRYRVIATYQGVNYNSQTNNQFHSIIDLTIAGPQIVVKNANKLVQNGQIVSGTTTVSAGNLAFTIYRNGKLLGSYPKNDAIYLSETGYYTVSAISNNNEQLEFSFTILSENSTLRTHSIPSGDNITIVSVKNAFGANATVLNDGTISGSGKFTIEYFIKSEIGICIGEENVNIQTETACNYSVNIAPVSITIQASVLNGEKSSKAITLESISAGTDANYTVTIDRNGKKSTYTKAEFEAMSSKDRTFSKTGTYTILVVDENGNQLQYSFQKYYKMNAGLIVLIAVLGAGVVVGLFFIIRIRLRAKVR